MSSILSFLPTKMNYIIFESYPDFDGSPKKIYDEFVCRNIQKKFKLVWAVDKSQQNLSLKYNAVGFFGNLSVLGRIKRKWMLMHAKLIVDSNRYVRKINPKTYRLYTQHGAPLKKVFSYTYALGDVDVVLSLSEEMSGLEHAIFPSAHGRLEPLGYPSNDGLFVEKDSRINAFWRKSVGDEFSFEKIVGWMPTYRQHRNGGVNDTNYVFPYGIPLFQKHEEFDKVNAFLKEKNILLAVQMHHAQADNFPKQIYSNIVLIPPALKQEMGISNANLMSNFDAMITDYSGAYHEYLLLNRPIALSIDDYDEYAKNPGFSIDYFDLIKGVYLRDTSDLIHFIEDVANGVDSAKEEREKSLRRIHKYTDGQSTKRVVDFLIEKANL